MQPFLTVYQSDRPMVCFLSEDLNGVVIGLMRRFIKSEKLAHAVMDDKLSRIVTDNQNHLSYKNVDVGFVAEKQLKDAIKAGVGERQILELKMKSKDFLEEVVKKMLNKCPISYSLVRNLSSLDPKKMATDPDGCRSKFNKVREDECDMILEQYTTFLDNIPLFGSDQFKSFNHSLECNRLDELLISHMSETKYSLLLKVIRLILVLSHGQASVKRGFSINKQVEVENLKEQSLVAQRLLCDHVKTVGGVSNVTINNKLLVSSAMARQKYELYLQEEREKKKSNEEMRKRKHLLDELDDLKQKKQRMNSDINSLTKSADECCEKAERTGNLTFVAKSNALRRSARDKIEDLKKMEEKLEEKIEMLRKC